MDHFNHLPRLFAAAERERGPRALVSPCLCPVFVSPVALARRRRRSVRALRVRVAARTLEGGPLWRVERDRFWRALDAYYAGE